MQRHTQQQDNAIRELQRAVNQIASQPRSAPVSNQSDVEELRNAEIHYANVILLLGYGGFFALWGSCADRMHPATFGLLGLSMGISLLTFVAFELLKTLSSSLVHNEAGERDENGKRRMSNADYLRKLRERSDWANRRWIWFYVPAVVFGLGAGVGLLVFFIRHTLGH